MEYYVPKDSSWASNKIISEFINPCVPSSCKLIFKDLFYVHMCGIMNFKYKYKKILQKLIMFCSLYFKGWCASIWMWIYLSTNFAWYSLFESGKSASFSFEVEKLISSSKDTHNGLFNTCHISPSSKCQVWWSDGESPLIKLFFFLFGDYICLKKVVGW